MSVGTLPEGTLGKDLLYLDKYRLALDEILVSQVVPVGHLGILALRVIHYQACQVYQVFLVLQDSPVELVNQVCLAPQGYPVIQEYQVRKIND